MDSSRRAVESYWRSRMIDGATSDEDKVTPVYKLEEICELLRTSHGSIVKEVSEFVLKRLDHKSPIVKQKALRLIKYAVGKSGSDFRREMQRNSAAVRQLFHYKGHPDPLKGDALNKAVRETAHEALSAMFSSDDNNKVGPAEDLNKRIQGFGNTNFEMPSAEEKSFLSEVIGIGSATLKQGLSSLTQSPSGKRSDVGNYKGPNLRRSLTREIDYSDKYARDEFHSEAQSSTQTIRNASTGPWGQDSKIGQTETTNGDASSSHSENKTREERLLETIVTSGGVRLQPTRDALQVFLTEASKLDALTLSHALESKLGSPLWQVRMKAVCVLEAILRKKDMDHFSVISSYFSEHADVIARCSESPQASLSEKANKVLSLLDGEQMGNSLSHPEKKTMAEATTIQLPDLIDTDGPENSSSTEDFFNIQSNQTSSETKTSINPAFDDLFGDGFVNNESATEHKHEDDPFADVSFHTDGNKDSSNDIFSGMTFDKPGVDEVTVPANGRSEPFDIFGLNSNSLQQDETRPGNVHDLMAGLSVNENSSNQQMGTLAGSQAATILPQSTVNANHQNATSVLNGLVGQQATGFNSNPIFPLGSMPYNMPPGLMFNSAFPTQPVNYGAMGNMLVQQQILATMSNFQQLGNLQSQNTGVNHAGAGGMYSSSALPDIFNPSVPYQTQGPLISSSKKEETKAFDFISDQLSSARDPKKVVRS